MRNQNYAAFVDNPPSWNPSTIILNIFLIITFLETNTYVYDFKGRVTEPSIKNFQLIPEIDGRKGNTLLDFIL